jgi:hypothetical protein
MTDMQKKRILIIAYYWPPFGGAGVFRIIRFARYLSELGYELAILTPEKAFTHVVDEKLVDELPQGVITRRTKIFEPTTFFTSSMKSSDTKLITDVMQSKQGGWKANLSKWLRLNLFIPDAKIGWYPFAIREGKKLIKEFRPDVILSTSPPPTTSLIAKKLATWSSIPWIADFRDPWTHIYYYDENPRTAWADKRNKRLEREVLGQADKLVTVSNGFFPESDIEGKSTVITNGFDPDEMDTGRRRDKSKEFTISYLGTMKRSQFASGLFDALKEICEEDPEFREVLKVEFYGTTVASTQEHIMEIGLQDVIHVKDFIPRKEAVDTLFNSDVLLLIIGKSSSEKKLYSTKLFEYISTGNAVLGLGPVDGVASEVLNETEAGKMYAREDKDGVKRALLSYYEKWKRGEKLEVSNKEAIEEYSFRTLTRRLSDIIQEI